MKSASLHELKTELNTLPAEQLSEICQRLARYKVENKELLTYLLFDAQDEQQYMEQVKAEVDAGLADMNRSNLYLVKKSLRKILRTCTKRIRYSGSRQTGVEVLLYFCRQMKDSGTGWEQSPVLVNLYNGQLKKIRQLLATLHEDLQYDYSRELENLEV